MCRVYYTRISPFREEALFQKYLNKVEEGRKNEIMRTRVEETRVRSLAAGSLLYKALCRELSLPETTPPFLIGKEPGGKPYLQEYPALHFNLSHSGDYVCCALGTEPVGIDIQKHTALRKKVAERFFTKEENRLLEEKESSERERLFFRIWSIRESYVKLTGKGLKKFSDFEIDWEQNRIIPFAGKEKESPAWFEEKELVPGYACCLCMAKEKQAEKWEEIRLPERVERNGQEGLFAGEQW